MAKRCAGNGNPSLIVKKLITIGNPTTKPRSQHMTYGIVNESIAVGKYLKQKQDSGQTVTAAECGLFIHPDHGELAATPDRVVIEDSVQGLVEVKCLSASRQMNPMESVVAKQKDGSFPLKLKDSKPILKDNHSYFYQIQMQMGVVGVSWCDLAVFTNNDCDVLIIRAPSNRVF